MPGVTFKKAILRPGKYFSPDSPDPIVVTPKRIKHWCKQHERLGQSGRVVPMHWDHADLDNPGELTPLSIDNFRKRRSSMNTVGRLKDIRFATDDEGPHAEITVQLGRERAIEAADANDVFVSPVIVRRFKTGEGQVMKDIIGSVDMVDHPVDGKQGPFVQCLSLRTLLADNTRSNICRFGSAVDDDDDYEDMDDDDELTEEDIEYDEDMGDDDMSDDEIIDAELSEPPPASEEEEPPVERMESDSLTDVKTALEALGLVAPMSDPRNNLQGFLEELGIALKQKARAEEGDVPEGEEAAGDTEFDEQDFDVEDTAVGTPEMTAMAVRLSAMEKNATRLHKERITERLKRCVQTGRMTPEKHAQLVSGLGKMRLSLGDDGQPKRCRLLEIIQVHEELPAGSAWPANDRMRMSLGEAELAYPEDVEFPSSSGMSDKQVSAAVEQQRRELPGLFNNGKH